ncbi:MAG: FtsW/RodA/SpoVE family cell cycle protein [Fastidiosipilaceae bacterium]
MRSTSIEQTRQTPFYRTLDYWLLIPVLCICGISLYVLSFVLERRLPGGYPRNFIVQCASVVIGFTVMLLIAKLGVDKLRLVGWITYVLAVGLQLMLPLFGDQAIAARTGSNSWLKVPLVGSMQPSEFSKIALLILVSFVLEGMLDNKYSYAKGAGLITLLVAPHFVLILGMQKDFGTAMVIVFMLAVMIFIWGIRLRYVVLAGSLMIIAIPLIWTFYLVEYQKKRILAFLYPGYDPDATYNVDQAKRAIAAGGLTGHRSGGHIDVPVQESDFIFSAVGELLGFVGAAALIVLIFVFLLRAIYVSSKATTSALRYMGAGVTSVFAVHSIENIGMCLGLLPVTGIPLPFVSQGGSAMVANFLSLGVLMAIVQERNQRQFTF